MLYIPKIGGILKILTDNAVKDLVVINFGEYFKSAGAKLYSKLSEEQFLRKVAESFYLFLVQKYVELMQANFTDHCVHHYIKILNLFDPELQLINAKPIIKSKLKELLSELKNFKTHSMLKEMVINR